ncbi:MAG TPA: addiction module protein [Rubrivivax sp.]|nr:addiction module protein [Rubrivivax sp.]
MPIPLDVLEAEALSLPQADRSRLIDRLIASLEKDPEWEAEWSTEADRREERIARGESSWTPGHEAVARIRAKLA